MRQLKNLAKDIPRPLANPKPLCTIPFNVSMSEAKTGTFDGAHQPVFVYLAAKLKPKIRIRFQVSISYADCVILPSSHRPQIEGTLWDETEERPFHDGKSITKGDLAMSIARKLEKFVRLKGYPCPGQNPWMAVRKSIPASTKARRLHSSVVRTFLQMNSYTNRSCFQCHQARRSTILQH